MAKLKHIQQDTNIESYYITLCDVYFYHLPGESEKEEQRLEAAVETLSSLIYHAISIDGTTIREMDNSRYEKEYKRFYTDIMRAIRECSQNEVDFGEFLEILDEIISAAILLANAFEKIDKVKEEATQEDEEEEEE